jgi:hypothetical protein
MEPTLKPPRPCAGSSKLGFVTAIDAALAMLAKTSKDRPVRTTRSALAFFTLDLPCFIDTD